jgi:hypothetical protein
MRIANGLFNQSLADLLIDAVESETNFLSHISQSQQTREIVLSLVYDH